MNANARPKVIVQLGVNTRSKPDLEMLIKRSGAQLALISSGQKKLAFLNIPHATLKSALNVDGTGDYYLEVDIPPDQQGALIEHPVRGRGGRDARSTSGDELQLVEQVAALVQESSSLVRTVAEVLSTSVNPTADLRRLEARKGVNTKPARDYLRSAQGSFLVDVEGSVIEFDSQTVRARVEVAKSIGLTVLFPRGSKTATTEEGSIRAVEGDTGGEYKLLGLKREFRFDGLQPLHHVLLAVARELEIPVRLTASIEISTCTLKCRPHDVHEVQNWAEIWRATMDMLQAASPELEVEGGGGSSRAPFFGRSRLR